MNRAGALCQLLVALLVSGAALPLQAETIETKTFDEAKALAAEMNVPLLLDFYTDWCKWCKKFDAESKIEPEIRALLGKVVLHKIDAEKGDGVQIAKDYQVQGFPSFILVNSAGEPLHRWIGYDRSEWLTAMATGVTDPTTIRQKVERFAKQPNEKDAVTLATYHGALDETQQAVAYLRKAQELKQDPATDYRYTIFENMAYGNRNGDFGLSAVREAADAALAFEGHDLEQVMGVARTMTRLGRKAEDREFMLPYLRRAIEETKDIEDEQLLAARKRLLVDHALFVDKDSERAVQYRKDIMPEGWMASAAQLNSFAWWCFENKVNLEEADTLARRGVELAEPGGEKAMVLDTLAEICNARGSCTDAVAFIEMAMREHPESKHYPKQLERFQKLLAAE